MERYVRTIRVLREFNEYISAGDVITSASRLKCDLEGEDLFRDSDAIFEYIEPIGWINPLRARRVCFM